MTVGFPYEFSSPDFGGHPPRLVQTVPLHVVGVPAREVLRSLHVEKRDPVT
jgi:hypothetical protein